MRTIYTLIIIILVSLPFVIAFAIYLSIEDKKYNAGTRDVDQLIKKTKLLSVNGIQYVTHNGALSGAIVGHMLAGDIGAIAGAMSAEQVHRDNEAIFLVYYDESKKGAKKEVEKVRLSSGRFKFLLSKLGDDTQEEKTKKQKLDKPAAASLPATGPRRDLSEDDIKTVLVPVGDYIVGDDIPAGSYTLSSAEKATVYLYKDADAMSYNETYSCEEPSYTIGKIILKAGMRIQVKYGQIRFSTYSGIKTWDLMMAKNPARVFTGEYIVGEDIPAGSYTLTSAQKAQIYIYENADSESCNDSYECEEPNYMIGKIILKNGMRVLIHYSDMTFEPFRGLGF